MKDLAEVIKALGPRASLLVILGVLAVALLLIVGAGFMANKVIDRGVLFEHGAMKITVPVKPIDSKSPS